MCLPWLDTAAPGHLDFVEVLLDGLTPRFGEILRNVLQMVVDEPLEDSFLVLPQIACQNAGWERSPAA